MVGKETTEKGRPSLSLNKALEELVVIPREGKQKNPKEDVLKAAETKQAWFSGTAYTGDLLAHPHPTSRLESIPGPSC